MNKCIILSRVSTQQQTLEQQTELLIKRAKKDGYDEKSMIIIEDKESAIKLSINEREGIKKLKSTISENEDVDAVYIFEISRLGRRMDVLIEMRDYFVNNQIQLFIYSNNMYLLDDKKQITSNGELVFTLFAQFAESEMKDKKIRMTRGKRYKRSQNKYIGGGLAFGYTTNEYDEIIIDSEKADIVRWIFNEYERGQSYRSIGKELIMRGDIVSENYYAATMFVSSTINRIQYTGAKIEDKYIYPQIISKVQFENCQDIAHNKRKPKSNIKNIYYCKNLLKSKESGLSLSPAKGISMYVLDNKDTGEKLYMNMNLCDSLTWHVVKMNRLNNSTFNSRVEREDATEKKNITEKKLNQCDVRIEKLKKEQDRVFNLYIKGKISENRYDEENYRIQCEIANIEIDKDNYNHIITEMMNRIIYTTSFNYEKSFEDPKSDEEISEIIHNDIERIEVYKKEPKFVYYVDYLFKDGHKDVYEVTTKPNKSFVKDLDDNIVDLEIKKRFARRMY